MKPMQNIKKLLFRAGVLVTLVLTLSTQQLLAGSGATAAGSPVISTNTYIRYTNTGGGVFSNWNGESVTNYVEAIFGFTNTTVAWSGSTNSGLAAGGSYAFTNSFTNFGNTNAGFDFGYGISYGGSSGSAWTVDMQDINGTSLIGTGTNVNQDVGFQVVTVVDIAGDAGEGGSAQITISNTVAAADAPRWVDWNATNGFHYGGYSNWTDVITLVVGGPVVSAQKSWLATNFANAAFGADEVVPGSIITYTITYTNTGSATAYNVTLDESLSSYVAFISGSQTGGTGGYNYDNGGGWGYSPSGVDENVQKVRFIIDSVAAGAGGSVTYKVVVR